MIIYILCKNAWDVYFMVNIVNKWSTHDTLILIGFDNTLIIKCFSLISDPIYKKKQKWLRSIKKSYARANWLANIIIIFIVYSKLVQKKVYPKYNIMFLPEKK